MDVQPLFAALADPTRREMLRRLSQGAASATELAAELPISRQAVAKHLAALGAAGLVERSPSGRDVRYTVTPAPLTEAVRWMSEIGGKWDSRLQRLRSMVE
jgi:DNA-binding transcriptional ArsR family regulator